MFTIIRNILSNVSYVLSGAKKADDELERKFIAILERRHEQRMSPEYDWNTMTHPDDEELEVSC